MTFEPTELLRHHLADPIAWLTTVTSAGRPAPRPVWFIFDGSTFVVYSRPAQAKLRHIEANPNVSLHFNTNALGGDVLVIAGQAALAEGPPATEMPSYLAKYEPAFARIGQDTDRFDGVYSVRIEITPERSWGF